MAPRTLGARRTPKDARMESVREAKGSARPRLPGGPAHPAEFHIRAPADRLRGRQEPVRELGPHDDVLQRLAVIEEDGLRAGAHERVAVLLLAGPVLRLEEEELAGVVLQPGGQRLLPRDRV